jgi:hypothetical protein
VELDLLAPQRGLAFCLKIDRIAGAFHDASARTPPDDQD